VDEKKIREDVVVALMELIEIHARLRGGMGPAGYTRPG
jgi:hypothetical protein